MCYPPNPPNQLLAREKGKGGKIKVVKKAGGREEKGKFGAT